MHKTQDIRDGIGAEAEAATKADLARRRDGDTVKAEAAALAAHRKAVRGLLDDLNPPPGPAPTPGAAPQFVIVPLGAGRAAKITVEPIDL